VRVSNLCLTVFVKHQVNWLNRFQSLPSEKERKKKKKTVNWQRPPGLLCFCPLMEQKPSDALSLFIKRSLGGGVAAHEIPENHPRP
jgi:hypothetical protein